MLQTFNCFCAVSMLLKVIGTKPGPKGQRIQEFRMVYHRKKGFTSQPVEQ